MQIIIHAEWIFLLFFLFILLVLFSIFLFNPIVRYVLKRITDHIITILLTDDYTKNLVELLPSLTRFSMINLIELSLRAQTGRLIARPLGSPKHFIGYDHLMFNPRQLTGLPLPINTKMDMSVTIGPRAEKPMTIGIPLMIAGMAYGLALSEEATMALTRASKTLQTAISSGEGPFLPEQPLEAGKFVLQICQWPWGNRTVAQIACAAMLEVKIGQGADMGTNHIEAIEFEGRAQRLTKLKPGQTAISFPAPPGIQKPEDWPTFIQKLRKKANGIPIALKIMATDRIEEEISVAIDLGFDAIMIDGTEGGAHATAPIKQDDFGIPSILALVRAKKVLKNHPISLVISGGYFTPGQCLKALALGADAIYLGTVPLFALGHNQTGKVLPWEPPTTLLYYNSPTKTKLDIDQAATSVANTLAAMIEEMQDAMRALGKSSLKELSPDDLIALDSITAEATGVKQVGEPNYIESEVKQLSSFLCSVKAILIYAHQVALFQEKFICILRQSQLPEQFKYLQAEYHTLTVPHNKESISND